MKRKILPLACGIVLAGLTAGAQAEVELSANVALTSDYVWRGVSQTNSDPAIQGGFDLSHESGLYAGVWGSNVEFGDDAHVELDLYGGYSFELQNGIGLDVGIIHFDYPSMDDYNTEEVYLGISYGIFSAQVNHNLDDWYDYYEVAADFELPYEFGLGLHVGYTDPEGDDGVTDWKIGLTKSYFGLDFELAYTDTDMDNSDVADGRAFLTVSKTF